MLRMLQKIVWGNTNNPDQSWINDLNRREIVILAPFLFFVLWIGLGPTPFLNMIDVSVTSLLEQFTTYQSHSVAVSGQSLF